MIPIFTLSLTRNTLEAIQEMLIEFCKALGIKIQIKHVISKSPFFKLFTLVIVWKKMVPIGS